MAQKVIYTEDDFNKALQESGLAGQFSDADLRLAQRNPDAGMSLLQYKQDYAGAKTPELRAYYNGLAEQIRNQYGGYTGGVDGSKFYKNASGFAAEPLPTYQETNVDRNLSALSNQLANRPAFSYSKNQDPSYSAYAKQYRREGQRATADALGQAAAATGGIPSTYAVGAASQAGDYYASKLADKIPELYQQAYQRYLDEYTLQSNAVNTLSGLQQNQYNQYRDTVGDVKDQDQFNYAASLDQYKMRKAEEAASQQEPKAETNEPDETVDWSQAFPAEPTWDAAAALGVDETPAASPPAPEPDADNPPKLTQSDWLLLNTMRNTYADGMVTDPVVWNNLAAKFSRETLAKAGLSEPTKEKTGNYEAVLTYLLEMQADGASAEQLRAAILDAKESGVLYDNDYIRLMNQLRG